MSQWIRRSTRLAVYLRDGLVCVYCGADGRHGGAVLVVDHLVPRVLGGGNDPGNLATACWTCNARRRAVPLWEFVAGLDDAEAIRRRVRNARRRALPRQEARELDQDPPDWLVALRERSDAGRRPDPLEPPSEAFHLWPVAAP